MNYEPQPVTHKVSRKQFNQVYADFNRHNNKSTFMIFEHSTRVTALDVVLFGFSTALLILVYVQLAVF